jgi:hypothetical protein
MAAIEGHICTRSEGHYELMFTAIATATPIPGSSSMPVSQQGVNVDLAQAGSSRPLYPRTQYTISRAHVTLDQAGENTSGNEPFHTVTVCSS